MEKATQSPIPQWFKSSFVHLSRCFYFIDRPISKFRYSAQMHSRFVLRGLEAAFFFNLVTN